MTPPGTRGGARDEHSRPGVVDTGGAAEVDSALLDELRGSVARFDPVPAELRTLGEALLSWRDPSSELAALVADSRELAGAAREVGEEVLLRFEASGTAITLEATPDGSGAYLLNGQLEPGRPGTVTIRRRDSAAGGPSADSPSADSPSADSAVMRCDEWGRFGGQRLAPGPLSLCFTPTGGGRSLNTAWVTI
jgi:hypothetical protein